MTPAVVQLQPPHTWLTIAALITAILARHLIVETTHDFARRWRHRRARRVAVQGDRTPRRRLADAPHLADHEARGWFADSVPSIGCAPREAARTHTPPAPASRSAA